MKLIKPVLYSLGCLVLVAIVAAVTSPKLSATVRAALTEVVIPSKPYHSSFRGNYGYFSSAPAAGTLGVTNLTVTNIQMSEPVEVDIFIPVFSAGGCDGGTIDITNVTPLMKAMVVPNQTLSLAFPTPMVFPPGTDGLGCVGVSTPQSKLEIAINGFVN